MAILKIPSTVFKKNLCSFCWLENENSKKKRFRILKLKPTQILPQKLLKEANIYFYCLLDESRFSDICTIMELKELNWLCKHMKTSEAANLVLQWIFVLNSVHFNKKKYLTAMVSCSRFFWITNSSDYRRVWTANVLHSK